MATTKNLCAQIPIDLHERVSEERERLGQTTSEYIVNLIQEYYDMIDISNELVEVNAKRGHLFCRHTPKAPYRKIGSLLYIHSEE